MTELVIKMTSWLVASMALGFIVAWLLSRIIYTSKRSYDEDTFSAVILERNNMIDKLEKKFRNKKMMFEKLSKHLNTSEESLAEKDSLLITLKNRIENSNSNKSSSLELKEKNNLLRMQIQKLEQSDIKRVNELEGLEEILLLAEEKVEENKKKYQQILKKLDEDIELLTLENEKNKMSMKLYEKNIKAFEEELKLYEADSFAPEFIISKDQFLKIEEQLEIYQEEIKSLKNENSELLLKSQKSFNTQHLSDRVLEDKVADSLKKENTEGSMVKVFRETYKKITKI